MSLKSIFESVVATFRARTWTDEELNQFSEDLYSALTRGGPIVLTGPIVIHNPTSEAAISIVNTADAENADGIEISDNQGRRVNLGIGLGSKGIFASNFVYDESYRSDPNAVQDALSHQGLGGQVEFSPGSNPNTEFTHPGVGLVPKTDRAKGVNSGFSYPQAGSGVPGSLPGAESSTWVPVSGVGEMLGMLDQSKWDQCGADGSHPPNTALVSELVSTPVWLPTDLHGWMMNLCTVLEVNEDTLTCQREEIGDVVEVAKPYSLQRTPFDNKTLAGVTYVYSDNQTRTASSSVATETQVISPSYDGSSGYSPGNYLYARWSSNGTNVDEVCYIDVNADARAWVATS